MIAEVLQHRLAENLCSPASEDGWMQVHTMFRLIGQENGDTLMPGDKVRVMDRFLQIQERAEYVVTEKNKKRKEVVFSRRDGFPLRDLRSIRT